ncbi:MAG: formyltransferase family protein [Deltaproteobacteria bacterium]|nr:formyltransferase family protein [Deltaproteobacteria bacterium]
MRIIVHGQQAFGKAVLEALLERGETIIAVYCAPEKEGQKIDPLKEAALALGLPVFQPKSFRKKEVWDEFAALKSDLCVMAYVTLFVPEEVLNLPTHGTIQYHPSLLPLHRGPSSINWPIIWGEKRTGLTIFWPDNGLDTGPILLQKTVDIGPEDTLGSLYFDHLFPMGVQAMLEGVDLVKAGKAPRIVQDESKATYEGWCKAENVKIDWTRPVDEVFNLIRGASPQPGAWSTLDGNVVQILESRKVPGSGTPGAILAVEGDAVTVAAGGGAIRMERVRPEGGKKISAGEFAAQTRLKPGGRLGN